MLSFIKGLNPQARFMLFFGFAVALLFVCFGLYIIFSPEYASMQKNIRVIFGSFLILYGFYRFTSVYFKAKNNS